ncbi:small multidrug efflux protein [Agrococcus terreus]|uniref:Small multidrug efflux protein n=1 Tax=Agrococcus terreus TaxID=574649 RepID=A0ABQ2KRM6_9MICO|nr:small multidrug efflux protein [Agrococcus terreus]GGN89279.1 hypothetical protein GCM10010968_25780 [Agrococcus terreus]
MNPIADLIRGFQELVAQVPEVVQPLIVLLAGMVPFIEGEGGAPIGVIGGIHPIVAGMAAAVGNFLAVLVVVLVTSRTREAVVSRRAVAAGGAAMDDETAPAGAEAQPAKPESKGKQRFKRWLVRFGVPGASLLGPLAIPTHFTAATLVGSGVPRGWVLLWQGIAIVLWTTLTTSILWFAVQAVLS